MEVPTTAPSGGRMHQPPEGEPTSPSPTPLPLPLSAAVDPSPSHHEREDGDTDTLLGPSTGAAPQRRGLPRGGGDDTKHHGHAGGGAAPPTGDGGTVGGSRCAWICVVTVVFVVVLMLAGMLAGRVFHAIMYGGEVTDVGPVTASPSDDRAFAYIRLENGLTALLVSDPDAETGGAALDVRTGSWYDPADFPGLAHAVEHCLFLGTMKYPGEAEYNAYLASHGGASNAYTDGEDTNYYFSVSSTGLEGALDRFAQFFIGPTFNASSVGRELLAVDSEHRKNLQSDSWRVYQLLKHVSSPSTPFHSFSTGSVDTLNKTGVRATMLAFHAAHYYASRMRLVVVGDQPLPTLARWVATMFAPIPSQPRPIRFSATDGSLVQPPGWGSTAVDDWLHRGDVPDPFALYASVPTAELAAAVVRVNTSGEVAAHSTQTMSPDAVFPRASTRGVRLSLAPVNDVHKVTLYVPLPSAATAHAARVGAASFISSMVGDEGGGSVLSYLKAAGIGESVSTSLEVDATGFALWQVDVTLSPAVIDTAVAAGQGGAAPAAQAAVLHAAADQVAAVVLAYVDMMRQQLSLAVAAGRAALVAQGRGGVADDEPAGDGLSHDEHGELVSWPGNDTLPAYVAWRDGRRMAQIGFRYPEKGDPEEFCSSHARAMHRLGPGDILSPPERVVWQPRAILRVASAITAHNLIVLVTSKALPRAMLTLTEPIYGSSYAREAMAPTLLDAMDTNPASLLPPTAPPLQLHLPAANPYLPTDFSLIRHRGYASLLGLTDIDALAASMEGGDGGEAGGGDGRAENHRLRGEEGTSPPSRVAGVAAGGKDGKGAHMGSHHGVVVEEDEAGRLVRPASDDDLATRLRAMVLPVHDVVGELGVPLPTPTPSTMGGDSAVVQQLHYARRLPITLWWMPDAFFGRPKTFVKLEVVTPTAAASPLASVLTALYLSAVKDALQEMTFTAARGGTAYTIVPLGLVNGVSMTVEGYSAVVPQVVHDLLPTLMSPRPTPARAAAAVKLLVQGLRNVVKEQPYLRAVYHLDMLVAARRFTTEQLLAAAAALVGAPAPPSPAGFFDPAYRFDIADTAALAARIAQHGSSLFEAVEGITLFVYGNENTTTARNLARAVLGATVTTPAFTRFRADLPLWTPDTITTSNFTQVRSLPSTRLLRQMGNENVDDSNSAVVTMYQGALRDQCQHPLNPITTPWMRVGGARFAQRVAAGGTRAAAGAAAEYAPPPASRALGVARVGEGAGSGVDEAEHRTPDRKRMQRAAPQPALQPTTLDRATLATGALAVLLQSEERGMQAAGGRGMAGGGVTAIHAADPPAAAHAPGVSQRRDTTTATPPDGSGKAGPLSATTAAAAAPESSWLASIRRWWWQGKGGGDTAVLDAASNPRGRGHSLEDAVTQEFARRRRVRRQQLAALAASPFASLAVGEVGTHTLSTPPMPRGEPHPATPLTTSQLQPQPQQQQADGHGQVRGGVHRALRPLSQALVALATEQLDRDCDLRDAAFDMLSHLIRDPAFNILRTQQQLGYIVFATARRSETAVTLAPPLTRNVTALAFLTPPPGSRVGVDGVADEGLFHVGSIERAVLGDVVPSLVIIVQGTAQPPHIMDQRVADFVAAFDAFLCHLDGETWAAAVAGVRALTRRVPISMAEAFTWEWDEVGRRSHRTARRVEEATALRLVRLEHVVALFRRLTTDTTTARIATVEIFGNGVARTPDTVPTGAAAPGGTW